MMSNELGPGKIIVALMHRDANLKDSASVQKNVIIDLTTYIMCMPA